MKTTDKVLLSIIAGIVLLVIAAFVVTLTRGEPEYQADDTPEGVVHNYLLAIQKEDYGRAYGYLSPTLLGYPKTTSQFTQHVRSYIYNIYNARTDSMLAVESAEVTGGNTAVVRVRESVFRGGDLFNSSQSISYFKMTLIQVNGEWKIRSSSSDTTYSYRSPYFAQCWTKAGGCK